MPSAPAPIGSLTRRSSYYSRPRTGERGYRTRGGGKFSRTTIERLVRDPTAKGERRANYTKSRGEGKGWNLKPAHEWVTSEVEAIVPEELWNGANALLAEKRAAGKPRTARRPVHLFAGLTFCHCGGRMYVGNTPKYVCKACRNKVPQADLERVFQEQLKAFFLSPEEVAGALSQADQEVQAKVDLLDALRREAERLKAEADEIFQLYLAKEITARTLGERHQPIEDRRVELEAEIPRLQGEIDFLKIQHLSREEVVSEAEDLYDRWEELTPQDRRVIIQAIVERVTVGKDEIEITLSCLPRRPEPSHPPPLKMATTYAHIPGVAFTFSEDLGRGKGQQGGSQWMPIKEGLPLMLYWPGFGLLRKAMAESV